jgi:DUF1680 family protein
LPNLTAYAETCAACGLVFWGHRLLELTGNAEYADIVERVLYNGVLSGISLDGHHYFYDNPLESRGRHHRTPWFHCACCPPNIARLLASVGNYAAGVGEAAYYLHFPIAHQSEITVNGIDVRISVDGNYPWSGKFEVHVDPAEPVRFALHIRIPDWADDVSTDLPDADEEATYESGYAVFDRTWQAGEVLKVDLGNHPKWVEADPRVRDNLGRTALTFGPLIYCAEQMDLGFAPQLFSADSEADVISTSESLLEGVTALTVQGISEVESFVDSLYAETGTTELREVTAKFIPYYAWNNRGPGDMQVWVRKL